MTDPASYHAWYGSARGAWFAQRELKLLQSLMRPQRGQRLLDLGCGTGYFCTQFADLGLKVTGLDSDSAMLDFARSRDQRILWVEAQGESLPFADGQFDQALAFTSLCFVADPQRVLRELWRVSCTRVTLALLNRNSLLYWQKRQSPGYAGARWDRLAEVLRWTKGLNTAVGCDWGYGVFLPSASSLAKGLEPLIPHQLPGGGILVLSLYRIDSDAKQ